MRRNPYVDAVARKAARRRTADLRRIRVSAAYIFATAATAEYLGARKGLGIWLQAAYNSFRTPLIFSATLVIIVITGILMCLVNLSERLLLGPADADADPDADQ